MPDQMTIEVLPDGTIKTETGKVSAANHSNAEAFIREIARLAGGQVRRAMRLGVNLSSAFNAHTHDGHTHTH